MPVNQPFPLGLSRAASTGVLFNGSGRKHPAKLIIKMLDRFPVLINIRGHVQKNESLRFSFIESPFAPFEADYLAASLYKLSRQ
jgi:hypothetical protein